MCVASSSFSVIFFFMMHVPRSSKIYHVHSKEGASRSPAKNRAISLMYPCSFRSILSYTSTVKLLRPVPPSLVSTCLNHFPLHRLRFRTFLLCTFPLYSSLHMHLHFLHQTISPTTTLTVIIIPVGTHTLFRTGVRTSLQH